MNEPIDLVLPYVSAQDPLWQKQYLKYNKPAVSKQAKDISRFREFGTIDLLLQLINKYCPWFRYIYLVVQMPSQVPSCVEKYDKVKIVYHKDIIPEEYLPTFNSNTIDLFLWKIPDLAEHYIYANDDIYPIGELTKDDFFDETGNPKLFMYKVDYDANNNRISYRRTLKNSEKLCNPNYKETGEIYRDGHSWDPMRKSTWQMLFDKFSNEIYYSLTRFRDGINITQQLYTYWVYFNEDYSIRKFHTLYSTLSMNGYNILSTILKSDKEYKIVCINDKFCVDEEKAKKNVKNCLTYFLEK